MQLRARPLVRLPTPQPAHARRRATRPHGAARARCRRRDDHVRRGRQTRPGQPRVPLRARRAARRDRDAARQCTTAAPARLPVRQRASDASLRARLRAALDESQRQREENARLREELALAHGRVRELELDRRVGRRMSSWPAPARDAALHGLAGEFVTRTAPHTETDPMALLVQFLVASAPPPGATSTTRSRRPAITSTSSRSSSAPAARAQGIGVGSRRGALQAHRQQFAERCVSSGLSSGEGLIFEVRDPTPGDSGAQDKRRLIIEAEFAQVLKVLAREGNTLSPVVRNAWDGKPLQTIAKNAPVRATGAHIAIIGHITKDELLRFVSGTELANGFVNRFLIVAVTRSQELPFGGRLQGEQLARVRDTTQTALRFASLPRQLTFNPSRAGPVDRGLRPALTRRRRTARRRDPPRRGARRPPRRDLRHPRPQRPDRTAPPRSGARRLALQPRLRPLDLRRHPRGPHRRRDLGARQRPTPRRHPQRSARPLQPQQESPRDRPRPHRPRRSRPPHPHKLSRRPRTPRRDLATSRRLNHLASQYIVSVVPAYRVPLDAATPAVPYMSTTAIPNAGGTLTRGRGLKRTNPEFRIRSSS